MLVVLPLESLPFYGKVTHAPDIWSICLLSWVKHSGASYGREPFFLSTWEISYYLLIRALHKPIS